MSYALRHLNWTEIPTSSLLAMQVFAQARVDMEDERPSPDLLGLSPREDALRFLRGEQDEEGEAMLEFWCEAAGLDPLTVKSLVRLEPPTLLERLEMKSKDVGKGSYIPVTPGELKAAQKNGATRTDQRGVWAWREWLLIGEGSGRAETANPASEVDAGGSAAGGTNSNAAGLRAESEEAAEEAA